MCLLLPVGPALAQDAPARAAIDAAELERFVDAFFAEQMAARHALAKLGVIKSKKTTRKSRSGSSRRRRRPRRPKKEQSQ